jgi:hypothetical protein
MSAPKKKLFTLRESLTPFLQLRFEEDFNSQPCEESK